jgi:hypothetical protein
VRKRRRAHPKKNDRNDRDLLADTSAKEVAALSRARLVADASTPLPVA